MVEEGLPGHLQALHAGPGGRVAVAQFHPLHVAVQLAQADLVAQFRYRQQQGRTDRQHAGQYRQARRAGAPAQAQRKHHQQCQQGGKHTAAASQHDGAAASGHAKDHQRPAPRRAAEHQQHHQHHHDVGQHDGVGEQVARGAPSSTCHSDITKVASRPVNAPYQSQRRLGRSAHPQRDPRNHHEPRSVVDVTQALLEQQHRQQAERQHRQHQPGQHFHRLARHAARATAAPAPAVLSSSSRPYGNRLIGTVSTRAGRQNRPSWARPWATRDARRRERPADRRP